MRFDAFGVARLEEGSTSASGRDHAAYHTAAGGFRRRRSADHFPRNVCTAVHNQEQLARWRRWGCSGPVTVWMKLDTGMRRLGVRPEEAEAFYQRPDAL